MSEQHPTIPGVSVDLYSSERRPYLRIIHAEISPKGKPYIVTAIPSSGRIRACDGYFPPDHAETVIAMIRDQVSWLKEQEARND